MEFQARDSDDYEVALESRSTKEGVPLFLKEFTKEK
jgi:hypothetical protein